MNIDEDYQERYNEARSGLLRVHDYRWPVDFRYIGRIKERQDMEKINRSLMKIITEYLSEAKRWSEDEYVIRTIYATGIIPPRKS